MSEGKGSPLFKYAAITGGTALVGGTGYFVYRKFMKRSPGKRAGPTIKGTPNIPSGHEIHYCVHNVVTLPIEDPSALALRDDLVDALDDLVELSARVSQGELTHSNTARAAALRTEIRKIAWELERKITIRQRVMVEKDLEDLVEFANDTVHNVGVDVELRR
jgi:hypothetical protein